MKLTGILLFLLPVLSMGQIKSTGEIQLMEGMTAKLELNSVTSVATLTLTGPSDRWFALSFKGEFPEGFGMGEGNDVVWYNGETLMDGVQNGTGVPPTEDDINHWMVSSNVELDGIRTIIASRPFETEDEQDYAYNFDDEEMDFAYARRGNASYEFNGHGIFRGVHLNMPLKDVLENHEVDASKNLKILPNPTSGKFSVQFDIPIRSILVYDANGKTVFHSKSANFYDISSHPAGIYFVEIFTDKNIYYRKIIKK